MSLHSFKRPERLKSRKIIGKLFAEGQSFGQYPLRLIWTTVEPPKSEAPIQCTVSVARKKFPKAAHRNRIRRQIKEAYRLNKHWLLEALTEEEPQYAFMILYIAKEPLPYEEMETAMKKMLKRFLKKRKFSTPSNNQK